MSLLMMGGERTLVVAANRGGPCSPQQAPYIFITESGQLFTMSRVWVASPHSEDLTNLDLIILVAHERIVEFVINATVANNTYTIRAKTKITLYPSLVDHIDTEQKKKGGQQRRLAARVGGHMCQGKDLQCGPMLMESNAYHGSLYS